MAATAVHPCERVLVVDDNEDMLLSIKDILEMEGAQVRTATSAKGAVAFWPRASIRA